MHTKAHHTNSKLYTLMCNLLLFLIVSVPLTSCHRDAPAIAIEASGYTNEVGKIILGKCAVEGCHNSQSKAAAAGLSLATWNELFEGGSGGSCIIPYRADYSTLHYYINTFPDLGVTLTPTMPFGKPPLTREEVITISDWINKGAPDKNGKVKFEDNATEPKYYVGNQGCDVVTVFDQRTNLAIRYVDVGHSASVESPHMIKVSPDNLYWYVVFINSDVIQKYRTSDNSFVGETKLDATVHSWNTFAITGDGKKAYVVAWESNGIVATVDLQFMKLKNLCKGVFTFPHGSAVNGRYLYVTAQTGNFIYKMDTADVADAKQVRLDGIKGNGSLVSLYDPHEIMFNTSGTRYYVTCQKSNEVRVMNTSNDSLVSVIKVGNYPVEMAMSASKPYLFVTCMEDETTFPGKRGSVYVIDYTTNTVIKKIYSGSQPHGIAVSEQFRQVYITNRNVATDGPTPHHTSVCGGRNGYVTRIDMNTLQLLPGKTEVAVDPYALGSTH